MTADTFDVWLDELKTIHSQEGDHCRADRRSWPCHMRRLIDQAEASSLGCEKTRSDLENADRWAVPRAEMYTDPRDRPLYDITGQRIR